MRLYETNNISQNFRGIILCFCSVSYSWDVLCWLWVLLSVLLKEDCKNLVLFKHSSLFLHEKKLTLLCSQWRRKKQNRLWRLHLAAMPTRGVGVAAVAHGDDDVDDMTVFGDVGADPALGTWNRAADMLRSWGLKEKQVVEFSGKVTPTREY